MFLPAHAEQKHRKFTFRNKKMHNYIFLPSSYLMFDFDPNKKVFVLVFLEGCMYTWNASNNKCYRIFHIKKFFFQKRQSGDFKLIFIHNLRRVNLVYTSFLMPPIAKPTFQWSTEEIVGPWNHRFFPLYVHLPVNTVCVALNSGFMWLRFMKPRISENLSKSTDIFQVYWNLPFCLETFHFIQEPFRLSSNSPDRPEIFQAVRKSSRWSRNI